MHPERLKVNKLIIDSGEIRRRIDEIKRNVEGTKERFLSEKEKEEKEERLLREKENGKKAAEADITRMFDLLEEKQKLLVENTDLNGEEFQEAVNSFIKDYEEVKAYLVGKYGLDLVDKVIKEREPSVRQAEEN